MCLRSDCEWCLSETRVQPAVRIRQRAPSGCSRPPRRCRALLLAFSLSSAAHTEWSTRSELQPPASSVARRKRSGLRQRISDGRGRLARVCSCTQTAPQRTRFVVSAYAIARGERIQPVAQARIHPNASAAMRCTPDRPTLDRNGCRCNEAKQRQQRPRMPAQNRERARAERHRADRVRGSDSALSNSESHSRTDRTDLPLFCRSQLDLNTPALAWCSLSLLSAPIHAPQPFLFLHSVSPRRDECEL